MNITVSPGETSHYAVGQKVVIQNKTFVITALDHDSGKIEVAVTILTAIMSALAAIGRYGLCRN